MLLSIVILLGLGTVAADFLFYRRRMADASPRARRLFLIAALATDLLPVVPMFLLLLPREHATLWMAVAMWVFFVYLLTVLPRLAYYLFRLFGLRRTAFAVAAVVAGGLVWGATYGRTTYDVREVTLRCPRLPRGFDCLRIVQFSDLHVGTLVRRDAELRRLTERINALHPDLVVFSGDLVNLHYTELDSTVMRLLYAIEAPLGVWSNIGNHDTGVYVRDTVACPVAENIERLIARQVAMGWRVPDNETVLLRRGGDTITLTGISFDPALREQRHDRTFDVDLSAAYAGAPSGAFNITLSHLPQLWEPITALGRGDLTLSGHVHAMQMALNLGCVRISPARLLYERWSGLYERDGRYLYINDGIGCVGYPMRLGAWPEITVITLVR